MPCAEYNFKVCQGMYVPKTFRFWNLNEGGVKTYTDFTGYKAKFTARYLKNDGDIAFELTTENGKIVIDHTYIRCYITQDITSALLNKNMKYNLDIIQPDNKQVYRIEGTITFGLEVKDIV